MNYDIMNNKCGNFHQLKMHVGFVRSYNGLPLCDVCKQKDLHEHELFYRCEECRYDLCRMCALNSCNPPLLATRIKTSEHACVMEKHEPNN